MDCVAMSEIENLKWDNRESGETSLRQMQLVELRLLRIFDSLCREHNLTYFIVAGTLLGAVRHSGFIPWDDDIDVAMPLDDALKFEEIAKRELPEDVFAQRTVKPFAKSHFPCIKLYDAYSSAYTNPKDLETNRHLGISLDVFTFIPCVNDMGLKFKILYKCMQRFRGMLFSRRLFLLRPVVRMLCRIVDQVFRLMNSGDKQFWRHNPWTTGYGADWLHRTEDLFPCKPIMFEGYEFMGPCNPDAYLRHYGDYMKLPPEDKRKPHEEIILPFTKCNHPRAMQWPFKCE